MTNMLVRHEIHYSLSAFGPLKQHYVQLEVATVIDFLWLRLSMIPASATGLRSDIIALLANNGIVHGFISSPSAGISVLGLLTDIAMTYCGVLFSSQESMCGYGCRSFPSLLYYRQVIVDSVFPSYAVQQPPTDFENHSCESCFWQPGETDTSSSLRFFIG